VFWCDSGHGGAGSEEFGGGKLPEGGTLPDGAARVRDVELLHQELCAELLVRQPERVIVHVGQLVVDHFFLAADVRGGAQNAPVRRGAGKEHHVLMSGAVLSNQIKKIRRSSFFYLHSGEKMGRPSACFSFLTH
jgi:hypothetical protein